MEFPWSLASVCLKPAIVSLPWSPSLWRLRDNGWESAPGQPVTCLGVPWHSVTLQPFKIAAPIPLNSPEDSTS